LKHCHAKQQERQQHWKETLITQSAPSVGVVIIARGVCCRREISPENKVLEIIELFKEISKIA
jgi:ribosomal protein L32